MAVERIERDGLTEFVITNSNGVELRCISQGATITALRLPGGRADVVLGFKDIKDYFTEPFYIGCSVGRVANRIRDARFSLDGHTHQLTANKAPHHLHGGREGFNKFIWSVEAVGENSVTLRHTSQAGSEGYPGQLTADVTYALLDTNEVLLTYSASCDAPTIVNLTNHTYFNLAGKGSILDHLLTIYGDMYTPLDKEMIAVGTKEPVLGTALDFLTPHAIGERLAGTDGGLGYDINYCLHDVALTHPRNPAIKKCATLREPGSGTELTVYTDQPGVQLYTGNFLDGTVLGKDGRPIARHGGVCLETQATPNAINNPALAGEMILRPGQRYENQTVWALSWD